MTTTHGRALAAGLALLLTAGAGAFGAGTATAADGSTVQLPVLASKLAADAACTTGSDQRATDIPWEQVSSSSAGPGSSPPAPG
ncbi:hypothetical protein N7U49_35575 [Streptomyces sp. AD2-2]|nr:hypothetical protein N7U49_35575 [Streptomyces sp. AD2-2]